MQKEIYFFMTQKKPDIFHDNDNGVHIKKCTKKHKFRNQNLGLVHIALIIQSVLDLFNINVKNLPLKGMAGILISEIGVVFSTSHQ